MDDLQATAKWANRILRPLTSIYRRLEKHQETLAIIAAESKLERTVNDNTKVTHMPSRLETVVDQGSIPGSDADEDDPVWIPGKQPDQRRVRHKFSNRGAKTTRRRTRISVHSPEASRTLPGAIELATPLITGKRWEAPSSAQSQGSAEQPKTRKSQGQIEAFRDRYKLQKSPWQELLDQSGDTGFADIANNLDRVLQNFLCNTRLHKETPSEAKKKPERGARSLMSMVARRLPEFIAKEQEVQDEMEENKDDDMTGAYFTELESFYAPHGRGWRPLREAVRAQGIYLVTRMIYNKWVTDPISCALIEKCRYHEPDACEALLTTFLSTSNTCPFPLALNPPVDCSRPGDPLRLLRKYASYGPAHRSYIFDELTKLLKQGILPPQWMSTKLWTSWMTQATISFSREDNDSAFASRLIEAVLVSSSDVQLAACFTQATRSLPEKGRVRATRASSIGQAGRPDMVSLCPVSVEVAFSNHITSLLSALCGIHISRSRALDDWAEVDGTKAGHIINRTCYMVERDMEQNPLPKATAVTSHQLFRRGCIVMANCLLHCNDAILENDDEYMIPPAPSLEGLCEYLSSRSDSVKELALLVQQAFRCFGGAPSSDDPDMGRDVRRMVSRMPHLGKLPCLSALLGQVAVETAMHFAEGTDDPDDHLWAIEIQETVIALHNGKKASTDTSDQLEVRTQSRGYRWEESIGEWVARTPAAKPNPAPKVIRGRNSMTAKPLPYIPCSTDSSFSDSETSVRTASSLTSSPTSAESTSIGVKRSSAVTESSPTRPAKRRRPDPVILENPEASRDTPSIVTRSSVSQREPSRRRILREMTDHHQHNRLAPTRISSRNKVEVVIINQSGSAPSEEPPRPVPESVQMQVHRTMERRRPGRRELSGVSKSAVREVPTRSLRTVIPCSDESDDELSFL
ncbi:hypothetical protein N7509_009148 [Penicillium cosmopolitanum]|uniref:Uncharacterized protein n=1 Tax=Penicillium cosmopolitanum TaxID=1131564 RepID=A0A9W9VNY4_9EURO|nr:uncharacterized protein N7509_009148 [Penicillium cosmopolitanum]KAJ5386607.1 hypothetical protein N7509_009148 [Penicillium cosmopolitanum]